MESIKMMAEFTEILAKHPRLAYDFISVNGDQMHKTELIAIIKELLYGIRHACGDAYMERMLLDVAYELDDQYDEQYQEVWWLEDCDEAMF